ncbi:MAG: hypothetical protein U0872_14275 [Planctomycetaceae bacterium]
MSQPRVEAWGSSQPSVEAWRVSAVVAREARVVESAQRNRVAPRGGVGIESAQRVASQPRVVARGIESAPRGWGSSQPSVAWESSQPRVEAWGSSQPSVEAWESSQR